jgi:hypothetical protein
VGESNPAVALMDRWAGGREGNRSDARFTKLVSEWNLLRSALLCSTCARDEDPIPSLYSQPTSSTIELHLIIQNLNLSCNPWNVQELQIGQSMQSFVNKDRIYLVAENDFNKGLVNAYKPNKFISPHCFQLESMSKF